jgi:hypothetical protein
MIVPSHDFCSGLIRGKYPVCCDFPLRCSLDLIRSDSRQLTFIRGDNTAYSHNSDLHTLRPHPLPPSPPAFLCPICVDRRNLRTIIPGLHQRTDLPAAAFPPTCWLRLPAQSGTLSIKLNGRVLRPRHRRGRLGRSWSQRQRANEVRRQSPGRGAHPDESGSSEPLAFLASMSFWSFDGGALAVISSTNRRSSSIPALISQELFYHEPRV